MNSSWRIQLFGRLCAQHGEQEITRFRTQKTGALLAYLAYFPHTTHTRDILIELLWPDSELEAARSNLSVAVNSLRRQLEPPGIPKGTILQSDRLRICLNPDTFTTDVADFLADIHSFRQAKSDMERIVHLIAAVELYRGELLPGFYEEWVGGERERLTDAYLGTLRQAIGLLAKMRDFDRALDYAHRAVQADPLREESYRTLMRLYATLGRPGAIMEQFAEMERALKEGLNAAPSSASRALRDELLQRPELNTPTDRPAPSIGATSLRPEPRLPARFTRFFGREEEITRLVELLTPGNLRLVTLLGPGGMGKTRLAIETAGQLQEIYNSAVWFVALSDLSDPLLIPQALSDALELPRVSTADPLTRAIEALSRQPSLLVLDNLEHLLHHEPIKNGDRCRTFEDGSSLVQELMTRVPSLTCLVTSRLRMDLPGEREFPLLPLPVPEEESEDLSRIQARASVQLFVDRAQAIRLDFRITEQNVATIGTLCARLEGMPLAIELAASRVGVLTVGQILEQLAHRLDFLAGRQRGVETRHRSLRAAIEWSYRLLSPDLQRFFTHLSVFRGGWTMEAAEKICATESLLLSCMDILAQLRDSSLIIAEESEEAMRFRMLDTLREFGQEQIREEEWAAVEHRHLLYFLSVAEVAEPHLYGARQVEWLGRLEAERDNLRAALAWSLQDDDLSATQLGLRLAGALEWWWRLCGPWKEGWDFLQKLLLLPGAQSRTSARAKALLVSAVLGWRYDRGQTQTYCEESLEISRELGNIAGTARALSHLGLLAKAQGNRIRAKAFFEEALTLGREIGNHWAISDALIGMGNTIRDQGDFATAKPLMEEGLAIAREMGNRWSIAVSLDCLGNVTFAQGNHKAAKEFFEESLALKRELGDVLGIANTMGELAFSTNILGNVPAAKSLLDESLAIYQGIGDKIGVSTTLRTLGMLAANEGDYETAMAYGEQSVTIFQEAGDSADRAFVLCLLGEWASAQRENVAAQTYFERSLALYRSLGNTSGECRTLHQLGRLAHARGKLTQAKKLFGEMLKLGGEAGEKGKVADALIGMGSVTAAQGDTDTARRHYRECLDICQEIGQLSRIAHVLEEIVIIFGAPEQIARILGAIGRLRETKSFVPRRSLRQQAAFDLTIAEARETLGETAWSAAWEQGRAMTLEQAIAEALDVIAPPPAEP